MAKRITSLKELNTLTNVRAPIEIQRAGGFYKARFRGRANSVFGATAEEAVWRLRGAKSKKWGFAPVSISNFEKQLLEACR